ncbi:MAG: GNAT family N-acetyltransferase [Hyphomicrobium sp.]
MTDAVTIRPLDVSDEDAWRRLFAGYIAFYQEDVPADVIDLTLQRLLDGADGMTALVAVDEDDRPIGLANLVFHRSTWSPTWYCYLEDLYVDPDVRGRGVGAALIAAVYAEADRRGASRTYWATMGDNATARALYDREGVLTPFVQYRR